MRAFVLLLLFAVIILLILTNLAHLSKIEMLQKDNARLTDSIGVISKRRTTEFMFFAPRHNLTGHKFCLVNDKLKR